MGMWMAGTTWDSGTRTSGIIIRESGGSERKFAAVWHEEDDNEEIADVITGLAEDIRHASEEDNDVDINPYDPDFGMSQARNVSAHAETENLRRRIERLEGYAEGLEARISNAKKALGYVGPDDAEFGMSDHR